MSLSDHRKTLAVLYYLGRLAGHAEAICGQDGPLSYKLACRDLADECDDQGYDIRRGHGYDITEVRERAKALPELALYASWLFKADKGKLK